MSISEELYTRLEQAIMPLVKVSHVLHFQNWFVDGEWSLAEQISCVEPDSCTSANGDESGSAHHTHSTLVAESQDRCLANVPSDPGKCIARLARAGGDIDPGWGEGLWRPITDISFVS